MKYTFPVVVGIYIILLVWSFQIIDRSLDFMQVKEPTETRRDASAQDLCHSERGPNSEARWTPEGHLICTTRRGDKKLKGSR